MFGERENKLIIVIVLQRIMGKKKVSVAEIEPMGVGKWVSIYVPGGDPLQFLHKSVRKCIMS